MLHLFHLKRWDTYCAIATASVVFLVLVSLRTHHQHAAKQNASTDVDKPQWVRPMSREKEPAWLRRHEQVVAHAGARTHDVMLLGDSLTQGWNYHQAPWQAAFPQAQTLNAGIASDRVEHVLWRVRHGLFDRSRPKVVVLMAGINNLAVSSPQQIVGGLQSIIKEIHERSPDTQILLLGLLPSGEGAHHPRRAKIAKVNQLMAHLRDGYHVHYLDLGNRFVSVDGTLTRNVSFDGVHLTRDGYSIWATGMKSSLSGLLGLSH